MICIQLFQVDAQQRGIPPSCIRRILGGVVISTWASDARKMHVCVNPEYLFIFYLFNYFIQIFLKRKRLL